MLETLKRECARYDETTRRQVETLYAMGLQPKEIEQQTKVKRSTIRTWIHRQSLVRVRRDVQAMTQAAAESTVARELARQSASVRTGLAKTLVKQTEKLGKQPLSDQVRLANTIAATAKTVFDWGTKPEVLGLSLEEFKHFDDDPINDPIDVTCGPDTTTGSVPIQAQIAATPQTQETLANIDDSAPAR